MYCKQCGSVLEEGSVFCSSCGTSQEGITQNISNMPVQNVLLSTDWKNSFFDGGLLGLIGVNFAVAFLSIISLGFAFPAMICYRLRWYYRHTVIGGHRLKFNGTGAQLFWTYILWVFLTIVTIGIHAFWIPIKLKRWELKHVEIESQIPQQ